MYKVAIVDDEREQAALFAGFVERFSVETGIAFKVTVFNDGIDFISDFKGNFDMVFMDIEMPHMDGMETSRRLRKMDERVPLVFVTNMAQYAIKGYEVNAVDFMVKPVGYDNFADKLKKAMNFAEIRKEKEIVLVRDNDVVKIYTSQLRYVEKDKNYLIYHTGSGDYKGRGTMIELEKEMGVGFSKCLSGCLVNLAYVTRTRQNDVCLTSGECLPLSRHQRKKFINDLIAYLAGDDTGRNG